MIKYSKIVFTLLLGFLFVNVHAQNDTIKKKKKSPFKTVLDGRNSANGITLGKEEKINPIFSLKKKEVIPLKSLDYYLNLGKTQKNKDLLSMSSNNNADEDVLVKRHFNGKDTSDQSLKSNADLGTFEGSTKFVRIEFRDHGLVDGDRVRIFLNEKVVDANIMLLGLSAFIELKMNKGYNRIDFQALNQGKYGPNTAAFLVYDDQGKLITAKAWNLATSQNATLGIIRN